jgi:hypothetical protein
MVEFDLVLQTFMENGKYQSCYSWPQQLVRSASETTAITASPAKVANRISGLAEDSERQEGSHIAIFSNFLSFTILCFY